MVNTKLLALLFKEGWEVFKTRLFLYFLKWWNAVLFPWHTGIFEGRYFETMQYPSPCFMRLNYCIDITLGSSNIRIRKFIFIFLYLLLAHLFRIFSRRYFLAENDVSSAFRSHNGNFSTGPCKYEISA